MVTYPVGGAGLTALNSYGFCFGLKHIRYSISLILLKYGSLLTAGAVDSLTGSNYTLFFRF